jgi:hypothetical protein
MNGVGHTRPDADRSDQPIRSGYSMSNNEQLSTTL